jgi:hypothetical protein
LAIEETEKNPVETRITLEQRKTVDSLTDTHTCQCFLHAIISKRLLRWITDTSFYAFKADFSKKIKKIYRKFIKFNNRLRLNKGYDGVNLGANQKKLARSLLS